MAALPGLASAAWYERGGARRLVQVLATDVAGPRALALLGGAGVIAYALGPLARRLLAPGRTPRRLRRGHSAEARTRRPEGAVEPGRIARRRGGPRQTPRSVALLAAAMTALAWLALARHGGPRAPSTRPDLLLVSFGSLGADSLTPESTPSLAAFADRGVAFGQALVSAVEPELARATWASGFEPQQWRAHKGAAIASPLDRLARAGYRTALLGDDVLARRLGVSSAEAPALTRWPLALEPLRLLAGALAPSLGLAGPGRGDLGAADELVTRALGFLDGGEGPFALAVFLPEARPPFVGTCARALASAERSYRGRCKYRGCPAGPGDAPLDEADARQALALRQGALACDDAAFGRLLEGLRARGLEATTLVVAFGEGGATAPRSTPGPRTEAPLDDRALHAPLLFRGPGARAPAQRSELVRDIDLAPTIDDLFGLEAKVDRPGRSLAGALRGEALAAAPAFAEAEAPGAPAGALGRRWALSAGPHRLVARATRRGLEVGLFDRIADPRQEHDLSPAAPALRDALRDALLGQILRDGALALRFGHVVPRAPAPLDAPAPRAPGDAARDRARSLLDVLPEEDGRSPALPPGSAGGWASTFAPDPQAPSSPHPARRRVTLGGPGGRDETRDALLMPAASTLRLPCRPGERARLRLAPAPLAAPAGPLRAEVRARREGASPELLGAWTLGAEEAGRWVEREIGLEHLTGLSIELELRVSADAADAPAVAWGSPALIEASAPELPYNVVLVSFEGAGSFAAPDEGRPARPRRDQPLPSSSWRGEPPLSAPWRGETIADFVPAATWRGPELLALLTGMSAGELGLDAGPGPPPKPTLDAFFARRPPLLAPRLHASGATTLALREGPRPRPGSLESLDGGFETSVELGKGPPASLAAEFGAWLERHRRERFFVLAQLAPPEASNALGAPPEGSGRTNDALDALLEPLRELGLEHETIVVVAPGAGPEREAPDDPTRFVRVTPPLLIARPDHPPGARPDVVAHTTDVAPTLLALEGLAPDPRMSGRPLFDAAPASPSPERLAPRARLTEGNNARALRSGPWLYVERDATPAPGESPERGRPQRAPSPGRNAALRRVEAHSFLFDALALGAPLRDRSGDRSDVAERLRDDLARELSRHRSADAARSEALAGSRFEPPPPSPRALIRLRFYGAGGRHRVALRIEKPARGPGEIAPTLHITPVGLAPDSLYEGPSFVDAAFATQPELAPGFDLELAPSTTPLSWHISWDDRPLADDAWLAGPYALSLPLVRDGLRGEAARRFAEALALPIGLSPARDEGVLVLWQELPDAP